MKKILSVLMITFVLVGCSSKKDGLDDPNALYMKAKPSTMEQTNFGYDNLPKDNVLMEAKTSEIKEYMANKESFIMYVGRTSCPYCQQLIPNVNKAADNLGYSVIYYNYQKEKEAAGEFSNTVDNFMKELQLEYVPIVYIIKDGEIVSSFSTEMDSVSKIEKELVTIRKSTK